MSKYFIIATLGCKLNFSESSEIARQLKDLGYNQKNEENDADLVIVNTCTVTELANKKSKQTIRKLSKQNPGAKVIAVGCYSQLKPDEVSNINGVNLVLGANNKFEIAKLVNKLEKNEINNIVYAEDNGDFKTILFIW